MKKSTICLGFTIAVAAGIAIWKTIQNARKEYKELELREKENKKLPAGANPDPEDVVVDTQEEEKEQVDYEINLPKRLFRELWFDLSNTGLPIECVDGDEIFGENHTSEHVVHVFQSFDNRTKRNVLNFLYQLPYSALPNVHDEGIGEVKRKFIDGNTCVGDFVRAIKGKYNHEKGEMDFRGFSGKMEEIVKDPENIGLAISNSRAFKDCRLEGYIFVTYKQKNEDGEWEPISKMIPLEKNIYENNPFNSDHTSMTDYIYDLTEHYAEKDAKPVQLETSDPENYKDLVVEDGFAAIRVSFNMQDKRNIDGINSNSALKIIKETYESLDVRGYGKGVFNYEHFLFYDPDSVDSVSVFDINKDKNTVIISELY